MARCSMYRHRESGTYFTVCSIGETDPPMPNADSVTWWLVDDCQSCKVPAGYPTPEITKKPVDPNPSVPSTAQSPATTPQSNFPDLGSGSWLCDGDLKRIFESVEPSSVTIFVEPCPHSSAKIVALLRDNKKPAKEIVIERPTTIQVVGQLIGLECGKGHETHPDSKCKYRIVSVSKC